ncbi:MAG: Hpt domain-containing protein [Bdellovibrionaceae bacterium]|nr:Hpt domain-containing protein [Pseudobdellovibrionaceae bacterium]
MSDQMNDKTIDNMGVQGAHDAQAASSTTWVVRPDPDLQDLIPAFMNNRKTDLVEIRQALARSDFENIRRTAHTLKGICRPYGFGHLELLSKDLESAGQAEDSGRIGRVADEMQEYLEHVRIVYDH